MIPRALLLLLFLLPAASAHGVPDPGKAARDLPKAKVNPSPSAAEAAYRVVIHHLMRNEPEKAAEAGEKALMKGPADKSWTPKLSNATAMALMQTSAWEKARDILRKSVGKYGAEPRALLNLGICQLKTGDVAGAEKSLLDHLALSGKSGDGYYYLGEVYRIRKEFEPAYKMFREAAALTPENPGALLGLADSAYALKQWKEAADVYAQLLGIASGERMPATAYFNAGYALLRSGRYAEAEPLFRTYLTKVPMDPDAFYNLACLYSLQGRTADAIRTLRVALEMGFPADHVSGDSDLEGLKGNAEFEELLRRR